MKFKTLFIFQLILILCSCEPPNAKTSKNQEIIKFDSSKPFEEQFIFLLNNQEFIVDSEINKTLYDSVENFTHHYFRLSQEIIDESIIDVIEVRDYTLEGIPEIKLRNIFRFKILNSDSIYAEEELINSKVSLLDSMKYFISNDEFEFESYYPEFKRISIPLLGDTIISKQFFYINVALIDNAFYPKTKWSDMFKVIDLIKVAYNEIRNDAAIKIWNKNFSELNKNRKQAILELHPLRIVIHISEVALRPPPPPPPPAPEDILELVEE
jgi:hypothetical protein